MTAKRTAGRAVLTAGTTVVIGRLGLLVLRGQGYRACMTSSQVTHADDPRSTGTPGIVRVCATRQVVKT